MSAFEGKRSNDHRDSDFDIQERRSRGARAWEGIIRVLNPREEIPEKEEDEPAFTREGSSMRCFENAL